MHCHTFALNLIFIVYSSFVFQATFSKLRHQNSIHIYCLPRPSHISYETWYSRITSAKSQTLCMKTLNANLASLTVLLLQSHDRSCYSSRPIMAPPLLRLYETHWSSGTRLRALPTCDTSLGWLRLPGPEAGDFMELLPLGCCLLPPRYSDPLPEWAYTGVVCRAAREQRQSVAENQCRLTAHSPSAACAARHVTKQ